MISFLAIAAATVTVTVTPPTTNNDGSPLTDLAGQRLEVGSCGAGGEFASHIIDYMYSAQKESKTFTDWNPATYCMRGFAINLQGISSDASPTVMHTAVEIPPPPPPFVTVSTVAYTITNANDRLAFLIVGSVPLGTLCDRSQSANGFNVVPRAAVTFDGATRPTAVLGRCQ